MRQLLIRSMRGGIEETVHDVRVVVANPDGDILAAQGEIEYPTLIRSAGKPFQAMSLFDGAAERFDVSAEEIALACASHNSERYQVEAVSGFLDRIGLGADDLVCGPHRSLAKDLAYPRSNGSREPPDLVTPSPLASNCSGKHTAMLAVARHHDWPPSEYHRMGRPVQDRCRVSLSKYCRIPETEIGAAVDGCGVVCWSLPLRSLATGYAALAAGRAEPERVITRAMMAHPDLVAGQRRLCTELMARFPGLVVAKVGASGVYGAALMDAGLGLALKVIDGNTIAAGTALLTVLDALELVPGAAEALADYTQPVILNTRHEIVGAYEAVGGLRWD